MMHKSYSVALFALLLGLSNGASAEGWTEYKSGPEFGFRMMVPAGSEGADHDFGDGWGGLYFESGDVKVAGIGKAGAAATEAEFKDFVVKVTGISADHWQPIASATGDNWHGFTSVASYHASDDKNSLCVGMGVGPKGNYVMFVLAPNATYTAHKADFDKWIESIHLD